MQENICSQCKRICNVSTKRLVQDSCGHKKCRACLLEDEENCKQCIEDNLSKEKTVDETNYTAVIACNGSSDDVEITSTASKIIKKPNDNLKLDSQSSNINENLKSKSNEEQTNRVNKRIYKRITIPNHVSVTTDPLLYHCNICNRSFSTKAQVKYHIYCAGVKSHNCPICLKEFILKAQLDLHLFKHEQKKPYACSICGKTFYEKSKLKRHDLLHNSSNEHICSQCGKSFKTKQSLKVHSLIHSKDKPYKCNLCTGIFNNYSNYKKHLISHTNEKVHMCDQCGQRFKLKWALQVHQKSHLKVRAYECKVCFKSFVHEKELKRHKFIHLDSKAYTCSICNVSFRRKDNLNRHIRNAHPGEKAEIIKNKIVKPENLDPPKLVDNPNAIHVITPSPAFNKNKFESPSQETDTRSSTVINGPLKLAFKTPAFKNNYNINRDFKISSNQTSKTYDMRESVNICQKILSPHSSTSSKNVIKKVEETSTNICQKILEPYSNQPIHYETSFQNRKHAMIKNIKFKIPIQYTMNAKQNDTTPKSIPIEHISLNNNGSNLYNNNHELQPVSNIATSVIVNNQPSNMHWRRRTSQNLNIKN